MGGLDGDFQDQRQANKAKATMQCTVRHQESAKPLRPNTVAQNEALSMEAAARNWTILLLFSMDEQWPTVRTLNSGEGILAHKNIAGAKGRRAFVNQHRAERS
ncbi:MAG: hypothetical protein ACO1QB_15780 [Verrucomicrobiales bacterium]